LRVSNDKAHRKSPRRTLTESRKLYRKKWRKVLKENPKANRDKLIKLANFEYLWLMRNDADWMKNHLPEVLKLDRKRNLLNWEKIDDELSDKVEQACQEIYSINPPKRVSITEVIKIVGNKSWLEKREEKLPKIAKILNEKLELMEDFIIRKIHLTEQKFIKKRIVPARYRLRNAAVISHFTIKKSTRIQNEITESLKRIERTVLNTQFLKS
jgi:hypothetical protein